MATAETVDETGLAIPEADEQPAALVPWSVSDCREAAMGLYASELMACRTNNEKEAQATAFLKLLYARDLGLPPVAAQPHIRVIKGNVTLSPHLMLALIAKRHEPGADVQIDEEDGICTVTMLRPNGPVKAYSVTWDVEKARTAGLANGENWKRYLPNMLRVRAIGECARIVWPDVVCGAYVQGEIEPGAFENEEPKGPKDAKQFLREHPPQDTPEPEPDPAPEGIGVKRAAGIRDAGKQAQELWPEDIFAELMQAVGALKDEFGKDYALWPEEAAKRFSTDYMKLSRKVTERSQEPTDDSDGGLLDDATELPGGEEDPYADA